MTVVSSKTKSDNTSSEHVKDFLELTNRKSKTSLVGTAEQNYSYYIDLLLDYGADYSIRNDDDFSTLHYCTCRTQKDALSNLFSDVSPDARDNGEKFNQQEIEVDF